MALNKDEINELMESGGCTDYLEENMTARRFYEACAVVYEALGLSKEKIFKPIRNALVQEAIRLGDEISHSGSKEKHGRHYWSYSF